MESSSAQTDDLTSDWDVITDAEVEATRQFIASLGDLTLISDEVLLGYINEFDYVKLNIAITGESGSGKSSFVNALRGLGDEEEQSAPTGVVETTMEPTAYPHPKYPNVTIWDLPGIGTSNFKAEEYLEKVPFDSYDFFILIASERFKSSSVDLAKQIQKMKKNFYFVRSKTDVDIQAEKRKRRFDQQKVLDHIRQDCVRGLAQSGVECPVVFLISSYELSSYDFSQLQETMERDLQTQKHDTFLISLPVVTMKIHRKKREALQARIWKVAFLSAGIAAVPIPGLSICADVGILVTEIKRYYQAFDLDDASLENLSRQMEVPVEELKACLRSPLNKEISAEVVVKMLTKAIGAGMMVAGHCLNMLPILGSLPAGALSFASTKIILENCLKELADDALNVLMRALQTEV